MEYITKFNFRQTLDITTTKKKSLIISIIFSISWWMLILLISVNSNIKHATPPHINNYYFAFVILFFPAIENLICIFFVDFILRFLQKAPQKIIIYFSCGVLFSMMHTSNTFRMLSAFGVFFMVAVIYLKWKEIDRGFGIFCGIFMHITFNLPAAIFSALHPNFFK